MELELNVRLGSRSDGSLWCLMGVCGAGMVCLVQTFNYGVSLRSSWTQFLFVGGFGVDFDAFLLLAFRPVLVYKFMLQINFDNSFYQSFFYVHLVENFNFSI